MSPRRAATVQGRLTREGGHATLHFQARLEHPPADVWDAITDPVQLSEWYMMQAAIDGREGGVVEFVGGPGYHVTGKILTWDPPRVLEYEWKIKSGLRSPKGEDSVVRWELLPDGDSTVVRLKHRHVTARIATGITPATHVLLERLAALLDGAPMPDMKQRFVEVQALYDVPG